MLMNTVQEFEEWSGLKVNLKKTCMLIIEGCIKRRRILGRVTFRGEPIKAFKGGQMFCCSQAKSLAFLAT